MAPQAARPAREPLPTGQPLTWDPEGRLASWQNAPSSPTTTTSSLGNLVEVTGDGTTARRHDSTTTTTDDLSAAGKLLAEAVNGTLTYLVTTHQGSVSEALDTTGTVSASQLYLPSGSVRYQSGSFPTSYGYPLPASVAMPPPAASTTTARVPTTRQLASSPALIRCWRAGSIAMAMSAATRRR